MEIGPNLAATLQILSGAAAGVFALWVISRAAGDDSQRERELEQTMSQGRGTFPALSDGVKKTIPKPPKKGKK